MKYLVTLFDHSIVEVDANNIADAEQKAIDLYVGGDGLKFPYTPANDAPFVLNVEVPDSMADETHSALELLRVAVGGDIRKFVYERLGYKNIMDMNQAFAAEQLDGIALAIYNIEVRNQGLIIGDQTGIGKGRQAAAMIRYGVNMGLKPIFLTEKANLFSDLYRDMVDIGSGHLKPFIVNNRADDSNIRDADNNVVYQSMQASQLKKTLTAKRVPADYNYIVATYSQFNTPSEWYDKGMGYKQAFLDKIAKDNIIILDESHNTAGNSGVGMLLQRVLKESRGVSFLSATFAKRPDNMPVYAAKTAMSDANLNPEQLTEAIMKGGTALQEVVSAQLVSIGQMIRRQRNFDGVAVNYFTLSQNKAFHYSAANKLTSIMRDIVKFQKVHVSAIVEDLDSVAKGEMKDVKARKGTTNGGVSNSPYFSKLFNVISQMLFSIKAIDVAEKTIERLQEGYSVIVAFGNTMESFFNDFKIEETINADFSEVLKKGLDGVLKITTTNIKGEKTYEYINPASLSHDGFMEYQRILQKINKASIGLTISPIDLLTQFIESKGYKVGEVTGRNRYIQLNDDYLSGTIYNRKKEPRKETFQKFQDNEYDVLLINQAGSTGASAHAIVTDKVARTDVRKRCMIVLQPELDINKEVQKRGRIFRTGQIYSPTYDYVNSEIPAEKRLTMMLKSKLKSLDANTSSDQKNSDALLDSPDFLNAIGDELVAAWLMENQDMITLLDDPLKMLNKESGGIEPADKDNIVDAARKVSGRIAILDTAMQEQFYNDILESYTEKVVQLKALGEFNLELEEMNLEAKTISSSVVIGGKNNNSPFGTDTYLEKIECNNLRKPYSKEKIQTLIDDALNGKTPGEYQNNLLSNYKDFMMSKYLTDEKEYLDEFDKTIKNYKTNKLYLKMVKDNNKSDFPIKDSEVYTLFVAEMESVKAAKLTLLKNKHNNTWSYLNNIFSQLKPAQSCNYGYYTNATRAIFVGFNISKNASNPYAPSKVKAKFAIAGFERYLEFPLSGDSGQKVGSIIASRVSSYTNYLNDWDDYIKDLSSDRHLRHIITGNLLQGYGYDGNSKLVNYTLLGGGTKKGLLLPIGYEVKNGNDSNMVNVPASKALSHVKSMRYGTVVSLSGHDAFFTKNYDDNFEFSVPASTKKGGIFFKNEMLLKQVRYNNFEAQSSRMKAIIDDNNLDSFLSVLQNEFGASIKISKAIYQDIADAETESNITKKWKPVKDAPKSSKGNPKKAMALAMALQMELDLLKLKRERKTA